MKVLSVLLGVMGVIMIVTYWRNGVAVMLGVMWIIGAIAGFRDRVQ